jgi:muramidase (phage lysozyme)
MADRAFYEKFRTTPQGQALLRMIRYAEGTERGGPDSYRVMFGGGLAPDLKQHPDKVITGNGYSSSAAGAYQFLTPTWQQQQKKLGLQSFGPVEQDIAALDLARQRTMGLGGLSYLQQRGLTPEFVAKLAPEWASLPTQQGKSYWGQPVKSFEELQKVYGENKTSGPPPKKKTASVSQPSKADTSAVQNFLKNQIVGQLLFNTARPVSNLSSSLYQGIIPAAKTVSDASSGLFQGLLNTFMDGSVLKRFQ